MDSLTIEIGAVVQHFKRNEWAIKSSHEEVKREPNMYLYEIQNIGYFADNVRGNGIMIVYKALYGTREVYIRTLEDFLGKVDANDCGQGYRFIRYEGQVDLAKF